MKTEINLSRVTCHPSLTVLCLLLTAYCLLSTGTAFAQIDERLFGDWNLEAVEITMPEYTKQYSQEDLRLDFNMLPGSRFVSLSFTNGQVEIGINHTNTDFVSTVEKVNALFTASKGQLTLTLPEKEPRTFVYTLDDGLLKINFIRTGEQYSLIYKK